MIQGDFFTALPTLDGFQRIADEEAYVPFPDDWMVGVADVVSSTDAILGGRYKAVNTAGAAAISAVSNALGTLDFPYVFTGDGMCYVVSPAMASPARDALAGTIEWVGQELGLALRGGEISVGAIRQEGRDVRVARFAPSPDVVYAMFSGGGLAWAEDALKASRLPPVVPDRIVHPDLSGLSCRFRPVTARNGLVISLIVSQLEGRPAGSFETLVGDILSLVSSAEAARPVPTEGLPLNWPPQGFGSEVRLQRKPGASLFGSGVRHGLRTLMFATIMKAGRDIGSFSPARYRRQLANNSDDRKFEDRLMMTIDCSEAIAQELETRLTAARDGGIAEFGLHRQTSALVTCVVPSPTRSDHVHFVDGGAGGYALAAQALKRSRTSSGTGSVPVTFSAPVQQTSRGDA